MSGVVSGPVNDIKACVSTEQAIKLVDKLYGFKVTKIRELDSYDDRNFFVSVENSTVPHHEFVLKIINSSDSNNLDYFEAQTEILLTLKEKKIAAPNPRKNRKGTYHSVEEIGNRHHLVKLFYYQPGKILKAVPASLDLCYQVGVWTAKLDQALKDFTHPGLANHRTKWHMASIPELEAYLVHVHDTGKRALAAKVIEAFNEKIVPAIHRLPKGVIHGDVNEANILVDSSPEGEWKISAILDFGDSNLSCYLFDVAAAVCYMMLDGKRSQLSPMQCGHATLRGYLSVATMSTLELSLLKTAVCARLAQSLVLGLYSHSLRSDSDCAEYILTTQKNGWAVLSMLWAITDKQINQAWNMDSKNPTS